MSTQSPDPQSPIQTPATPAPTPAAPAPSPSPRLVTVNAVHWQNILEFTHLFRSFRLAINPAKLFVALLAITLIYVSGRLFDFAWGPQVFPDEISHFVSDSPDTYRALRASTLQSRDVFFRGTPRATYAEIKASYLKEFQSAVDAAHAARLRAESTPPDPAIHLAVPAPSPAQLEQQLRKAAADALNSNMQRLNALYGKGIFQTFLTYETSQFDSLIDNTLSFIRLSPASPNFQGQTLSGGFLSRDPDRLWRSDTVLGCIANMFITGPRWLFTGTAPMQAQSTSSVQTLGYHALYLGSVSLFAIFSLLMLALAGAAISRLSALELAGIDGAPLKDVALFAIRRLFRFIKAPLAPFLIILVIGFLMALVATLGAIPYVGPVLIGLLFFAFLAVAFVLMLLLLGTLGGFNLLYPTLAVEGADSFDAMSRSFAYAYARPWRLAFYTLISLVYGAITFLFLSFALYLLFLLTHTFVGWGMNLFGSHDGAYSGLPALQTIWPQPEFLRLANPVNWYAMSIPELIGSGLIHFWAYLCITALGAYVLSFYFSSHTIIYLLLRRSVDGQNLTDVLLDDQPK